MSDFPYFFGFAFTTCFLHDGTDNEMHGVDWSATYTKYLPLVARCSHREELDDVFQQMAAELSALHVFVYGGEYRSALQRDDEKKGFHEVASLGVGVSKTEEGFVVREIWEGDPDFDKIDGRLVYSPLGHKMLKGSSQKGVEVGDVIVGIDDVGHEDMPAIGFGLRGKSGMTVKLEIVRAAGGGSGMVETIICVPISGAAADYLRYQHWEWKTAKFAIDKARSDFGLEIGYIHMRDMSGPAAEDR